MHKSLFTVVLIALWLGVSPLVKADPFGTSIKYPGIPCLIIAEVQVDGVSASMHDTVGAFVGAELRGKTKVVNSGGKAYVALMVNVEGASNTVTLKVHVAETDVVLSATSGGAASLLVSTAGTVGSGASPVLIEASTSSGGTGGGGVPPPIKPVITSVTASWGTSLNGTEINSDGIVTVVTSDAEDGQTVTVTLNGVAYNGSVANGFTVVTIAAADLQGLDDGSSYTMAANVSDAAGNAATEVNGIPFIVDSSGGTGGGSGPSGGGADPFGTSIKYPGIPCLIIGEVHVNGLSASMDDTVGAFVGAELRGKAKVVNSDGKAYVALMVNVEGASNTVTLKVHVAGTDVVLSATSGGAASLLVSTAGTVGSGASPTLIEASTNSGGTGGGGVPPATKPVITLLGNATETVEAKGTYTDAGAIASDTLGGSLSVTSVSTVNTQMQ